MCQILGEQYAEKRIRMRSEKGRTMKRVECKGEGEKGERKKWIRRMKRGQWIEGLI